jgi:hypothetical protein
MRRSWMIVLVLSIILTAALPAMAQQSQSGNRVTDSILQVGVQTSYRPFGGITIKKHITNTLMLQGTVSLMESTGSFGTRLLFDLGTKGDVFRYTGIGVAMGYYADWSESLGEYMRKELGFEALIGIDYPLSFFGKDTPLSASLEVALQAIGRLDDDTFKIHPRTGVNAGLTYWF